MAGKIEAIQHKVICAFRDIRGIDAIVLGGSRVTGTAGPQSDLDIGLYYNHTSLDIESLKQKAAMLDDERRDHVLTNPGEWGPWINGGGWLRINGLSVDILYRSSSRVAEVIDSCMHGTIDIDYQCGHPFGFVSSIYLGEVAYCQILHSNSSIVSDLKAKLVHFPETYQKAAIEKFLWNARFR
ncbi:MAG TPA: nucleotidyltransferase domain-containing protein [Candidatus Limiplasma sp.]|nr:nucleotidyltransferase domain-containing protein [Candidatus Limiplasma sp.]